MSYIREDFERVSLTDRVFVGEDEYEVMKEILNSEIEIGDARTREQSETTIIVNRDESDKRVNKSNECKRSEHE